MTEKERLKTKVKENINKSKWKNGILDVRINLKQGIWDLNVDMIGYRVKVIQQLEKVLFYRIFWNTKFSNPRVVVDIFGDWQDNWQIDVKM